MVDYSMTDLTLTLKKAIFEKNVFFVKLFYFLKNWLITLEFTTKIFIFYKLNGITLIDCI